MGSLTLTSTTTLSNATSKPNIPLLGFGVWDSPKDLTTQSCLAALRTGYRHIDTAQAYGNEAEVGAAIAQSGLPRDQIFVTSKIVSPAEDDEATYSKVLESVRLIDDRDNGYLDLMLIHNQAPGKAAIERMWRALERAYANGKIKAIGVSNFGIGTIEAMKSSASIWPPAVNQLELHPFNQQREITSYCVQNNIVLEAYCPLIRNQKASDSTLASIAAAHGTSTQQVLLRYALEKGWIPLPKSDNAGRIQANADLFGFELEAGEMRDLDGLEGERGREALVVAVDNEAVR